MEAVFTQIMLTVLGWYNGFLGSTFFLVLKICAGIYVVVLILDILLLAYLGGFRKRLRALKYGTSEITQKRGKRQKQWKKVFDRLNQEQQSEWKLAILEAEHLVLSSLDEVGYHGETFADRLAQIPPDTCSSVEAVRSVHTFRNKVVHDDNMIVSREQAKQVLEIYYDFLGDLGAV